MTKVTHLSRIEAYELKDTSIEVHYSNPWEEENSIYSLNKPAFEMWLNNNGKLNSYIEKGGDMIPGNITVEEYWNNTDYKLKCADMTEFMLETERKQLSVAGKMLKNALVDDIHSVSNPEFAAKVLETVLEIEETARAFQMLEPLTGKTVHADVVGQATV